MSVPAPAHAVQPEHIERAYAQLRKPGWPSLAELRDAYLRFGVIRARAAALAAGQVLPPEPTATPPPPAAARHTSTSSAPLPHRRRSDATAFDPRAAAAGEFLHPDE